MTNRSAASLPFSSEPVAFYRPPLVSSPSISQLSCSLPSAPFGSPLNAPALRGARNDVEPSVLDGKLEKKQNQD